MTPAAVISKWKASQLRERQAAQEHFCDLCRLFEHPTPAELARAFTGAPQPASQNYWPRSLPSARHAKSNRADTRRNNRAVNHKHTAIRTALTTVEESWKNSQTRTEALLAT